MRLGNLKIQIALTIPYGHPDKNGVIYSKEKVNNHMLTCKREDILRKIQLLRGGL